MLESNFFKIVNQNIFNFEKKKNPVDCEIVNLIK